MVQKINGNAKRSSFDDDEEDYTQAFNLEIARMKKHIFTFVVILLLPLALKGQPSLSSDLHQTIKAKDSLLFNIGLNTCDISIFENLISENFEFYHDQSGVTQTKTDFISSIRNGLCKMDYKVVRYLIDSTLNVYPMKKNDTLYGAIQTGEHHFLAIKGDNPPYLTSIAKFTHVWLLQNGEWKLSRVLSYDHQDFEEPVDEKLLFTDKSETNRWLKQKRVPALGIGYIDHGKIIQVSVFGELEKGKPAPDNTLWNVASLTKPVTALVALKLIDKGKWDLDEPIYNYYTDPDVAENPYSKKLTTRIILSHQTGFPNWRTGKLAFEFEPGTKYQYSGEGYEYLRKALENKFGKSLNQLADELIFHPLKMQNTHFFWSIEADETKFAKWHNDSGELYATQKNVTANAADDLLTTVEDYTKFMLYVINGAGLSMKLQQELTANQVRINDYKHFGLGWWIDENINSNQRFAMVHGGDDRGVHTIAFIVPETKSGLLILTNSDNGTSVFADVLLRFLGNDGQGILAIEMKS